MLYSIAALDDKELEAVQILEKQIGKRVLAMKPLKIEFDDLSDDDVGAIQMLEVDTGLVIVAVK